MKNGLRAKYLSVLVLGLIPAAAAQTPDLILRNGHIFTGTPAHLWVQAVSISGDRIVTVAFALNPINHNAASPTIVPGSDIIQFVNQPDPFCHTQMQPPSLMPPPTFTP